MNTMKKLVSTALSVICGIGMCVPLGAFSEDVGGLIPMETGEISSQTTTYDPCDVNHSGNVDIMDALAVTKYLQGNLLVSEYDWLDADRSHVVDSFDIDCVMARITDTSYSACYKRALASNIEYDFDFPPVSSSITLDAFASSTSLRSYTKHIVSTGQNISYNLSPSSTPMMPTNAGNSTSAVIGYENRHLCTGSENTGIVLIEVADSDGDEYWATGFLVGDNQIATCAHCVYLKYKKVNNMNVLYDEFFTIRSITLYNPNGTKTNYTVNPVEIHIPTNYISNQATHFDYALITFSASSTVANYLENCTYFNLGVPYNTTTTSFMNIPLYATGIPGTINDTSNSNQLIYRCRGTAVNTNEMIGTLPTSSYELQYNMDTSEGESGCPVYAITEYMINGNTYRSYTVLAVHSGGSTDLGRNGGARITKYQLQFYYANPNANYGANAS